MRRAGRWALALLGLAVAWVAAGVGLAAWIDKQITDAMEDLDCE